ncbi:MAG: ABC transporter substrate-binding protein [Actinobacteria bacterium]|nr:ABC transporter substrate-binding protein [Actinomycetota bacterium]
MRIARACAAVALAAGLLLGLVGCGGSSGSEGHAAALEKVSLQLNWFHEAEFVGYYVARAKGFYEAEGLDVEIREGGPGDPAIGHVLDGTVDFAISSFDETAEATAAGQPVVAVLAAFQIPPLVIFSLDGADIERPGDLVGKHVGVTTDYWREVLNETLLAANVEPSRVKKVAVEPGDLEALYRRHEVDAWLGYAQDEPIKVEMAGYDVSTMYPADYGVGGYEGLVLVRDEDVRDRPDVVGAFVHASQRGWRYAVEHPDEAAAILLDWAPDPGLEFQKAAVRVVGPLVDAPGAPIGWVDEERWRMLMGAAYRQERPGFTMRFSSSAP